MIKMKEFKTENMDVPNSKEKVAINIGALLDIPGGEIKVGAKGEHFINGGFPRFTGLIGSTNNYKTTIAHYFTMKALERTMESGYPSHIDTFDTEVTMSPSRLENLATNFAPWVHNPISRPTPIWKLTDASAISGNEWVDKYGKYCESVSKNKSLDIPFDCFEDPYTKKAHIDKIPTFCEVDSLSKLKPEKVYDKLSENDLDSSDTNTVFMAEGMFKKKFLTTLPRKAASANSYIIMTAHVSEKIDIATGPAAYVKPSKQLQSLKNGDTVKGTSEEFKQLPNIMYQAHTATLLNNKATKKAEYPLSSDDSIEVDMNCIRLTILRNKLGGSGYTIPIVVTQIDGVIPELTEFHFIKEVGKYGIDGSNISYFLNLYPEEKLSRTTVRKKLKDSEKLRRALNFTAEMLQLNIYHSDFITRHELNLSPSQVYQNIIDMGYDWDILLNTRGYWLIDQYNPEAKPFLSTVDLLMMAKGKYHPWWYDKKGIKNESIKG